VGEKKDDIRILKRKRFSRSLVALSQCYDVGSLFYLTTVRCNFLAGFFYRITQPAHTTAHTRDIVAVGSNKRQLSDKIRNLCTIIREVLYHL